MVERKIKEASYEDILEASIGNIRKEIIINSPAPGIRMEFSKAIGNVMESVASDTPLGNPTAYLAMTMEVFIQLASKSLVATASINPRLLQKYGDISEERIDLLRRDIEEYMLKIAIGVFKKNILQDHISLSEFIAEKQKEQT